MKLQVIIGSTRPGRVSDRIGNWIVNEAKNLDDTQTEVVDLIDYELPFFNEPISPQYNPERKPSAPVKKWLDKVAQADAYVIVTPEYNRSITAVLKNAIDFLDFQFKDKPVAIVGHGSSGGAQAVASLRPILAGVKSFSTPSTTYVMGRAAELIDESGELIDEEIRNNPYGPQVALQATLSELKFYSDALAAARK
jgi:NAD(P)H-dependent FMN reductase